MNYTQLTTSTSPSPLCCSAIAFDPVSNPRLLFGGILCCYRPGRDTWHLQEGKSSLLPLGNAPSPERGSCNGLRCCSQYGCYVRRQHHGVRVVLWRLERYLDLERSNLNLDPSLSTGIPARDGSMGKEWPMTRTQRPSLYLAALLKRARILLTSGPGMDKHKLGLRSRRQHRPRVVAG